jgi:hypothetical protein
MDETIIVEDGAITVRCIQPLARDGEGDNFPLLVWLHGGGRCLAGFHFACPDDASVQEGSREISTSMTSISESLASNSDFVS